jgi:hypothetical protein
MRTWGIVILLASASGAIQAPPRAWADPPNLMAAQPSDQEIAELIDRTEQQVANGHVWAPPGDNALETVQRVLALADTASPKGRAEIDAMPRLLRQRAAIADAAGHSVEARRFMLFAEAVAPGSGEHAGTTRAGRNPRQEPSSAVGATATNASRPPTENPPIAATAGAFPGPAAGPPPVAPVAEAPPHVGPSASVPPHEAEPPPTKVMASLVPGTAAPPALPVAPVAEAPPHVGPSASAPPHEAEPPPAKVMASLVPGTAAPSAPPAAPVAVALPPAVIAALIQRGNAMLALGDISAARLLYERAARAGSGEATADVGRTHDPTVLAQLGTRGMQPDPVLAAAWYRHAIALGDAASAERLQRLQATGAR